MARKGGSSLSKKLAEELGPPLFTADVIQKRVRELGAQITRDYQGCSPHLIAILKGASIFHADLVRSIDLPVSCDFWKARMCSWSRTSSTPVLP